MNIRVVKKNINELFSAQYNPRKDLNENDSEYQKLKKSIEEFGYVDFIIYNANTGNIIGGNQRIKVLKDLGYKEIDVIEVNETIEREKALNIALNKIDGQWDILLLKDLLEELDNSDVDIALTGFEDFEIEQLATQYSISDDEIKAFFEDKPEDNTKNKKEKTIVCPYCNKTIIL